MRTAKHKKTRKRRAKFKAAPAKSLLAHHLPLGTRVSEVLKQAIKNGQWRNWLPGDRELSRMLIVSRTTCGQALDLLEREGWVERLPKIGTKITENARHLKYSPSANASVTIIMPHPVSSTRPKIAVWVDNLREQLANEGLRLTICSSPRFYGPNPSRVLAATVRQQASACWLLLMTTRATQEWFARAGLPCLTIGTNYEGLDLPSVGIDLLAVGRHAAGTLIAAGHRSLGFLCHRLPGTGSQRMSAGDVRFAKGFLEACQGHGSQVQARAIEHEETLPGVEWALRQCVEGPFPCTGIVVANPHCYLSVTSLLAGRGLRVPGDLSLICREEDPFLDFVSPPPAHYCGAWELLMKEIMLKLPRILNGNLRADFHTMLFPRYAAGESIRNLNDPLDVSMPASVLNKRT